MQTSDQHIEELIQAYHAGELSTAQQEELLALVQTDPSAKELFRQYAVLRYNMPVNENGGHEKAYEQFRSSTQTRVVRMRTVSYWAAAASIVLLAGLFLWMRPQPAELVRVASAGIHALPDNTKITSGQGTELSYSAEFGNERNISMQRGQAFFEVKRDTLHPFTVQLPNGSVRVLGTSFNIKIDSLTGNTTLTVVSGRVQANALASSDNRILTKGQMISFTADGTLAGETIEANGNELSWKTGKLIFASTAMPDVIRAINNHFGSSLTLESHALDSCKLNASFTDPELPKILDMLKIAFDIEVIEKEGTVILRGTGC